MNIMHYLWDPVEDNIVREFDDVGDVVADYTTEPDRFGSVIGQRSGGQSRFFHHDGLGSTLAVTDESENVTDTRSYAAFGETTQSSGSTVFPFHYIGRKGYYTDSATGECLVRRRAFEPQHGLWLSQDPMPSMVQLEGELDILYGNEWIDKNVNSRLSNHVNVGREARFDALQQEHPYVYARNNPIRYTDPSGLTVSLRCGPVIRRGITLGMHCAIIVECNGKLCIYDGGGDKTTGKDPAHPDRPVPKKECPNAQVKKGYNVHDYKVCTRFSTCEMEMDCLNNAFAKILQEPYKRLGPNSNTYAHNLLCVCSMQFVSFEVQGSPDPRLGTPGPVTTISAPPHAVGWDSPGYDCKVAGGPTPDCKICS